MASLEELTDLFSQSISLKAKAMANLELDPTTSKRIKESISEDIRKFTDLIPPLQSERATEKSKSIPVELSLHGWHDQNKFDKGRSIFHLEHLYPVSQVRDLCLKASNSEGISLILKEKAKTVWILKEEDQLLTDLGFRTNRPDPYDAYKKASIVISEEVEIT